MNIVNNAHVESRQKIDPEVSAKPKRRILSAAYKLDIVRQADACKEDVEIGALLRREGLYSSQLCMWRKLRDKGGLSALSKRRGRNGTRHPLADENARLQREMARLTKRLEQAETIISIQKKVCSMLGIEPMSSSSDESNS